MLTQWDADLLLRLNVWPSQDAQIFLLFATLVDNVPWLLAVLAMVAVWFTGQGRAEEISPESYANRERMLLIVVSVVLALLCVELIQAVSFRPRPFLSLPLQIPVNEDVWAAIVQNLRRSSSFPSDTATVWFAFAAGILQFKRRWGLLALLLVLSFTLMRISIAYVYPTDVIAGAALGCMASLVVMRLRGAFAWLTHSILQGFRLLPALMYPLGLLVLFDISQNLNWFSSLIAILFNISESA